MNLRYVIVILVALLLLGSQLSLAQNNEDEYFYLSDERTLMDSNDLFKAKTLFESRYQQAVKDKNTRDQAKYLKNIADSLENLKLFIEAKTKYDQAYKVSLKSGDRKLERAILNSIGIMYSHQSNFAEAKKYYEKSLKIAQEINYNYGIIAGYNNLGNLYQSIGELDKAEEYLLKARDTAYATDNKQFEASIIMNLGNLYNSSGKFDKAKELLTRSIEILENSNDRLFYADVLLNLALVEENLGDYKSAIDRYNSILPIYEQRKDFKKLALLYLNIAGTTSNYAMKLTGKSGLDARDQARTYYYKSYQYAIQSNSMDTQLLAFDALRHMSIDDIMVCKEMNSSPEYQKIMAEVKKNLEGLGSTESADIIDQMSQLAKNCTPEKVNAALLDDIKTLETMAQMAKDAGLKSYLSGFYKDIALDYKDLGQYDKAIYYYNETINLKKQLSAPNLWKTYYALALLYQNLGNNKMALESYDAGLTSILDISQTVSDQKDKLSFTAEKTFFFTDFAEFKKQQGDIAGAMELLDLVKIAELANILLYGKNIDITTPVYLNQNKSGIFKAISENKTRSGEILNQLEKTSQQNSDQIATLTSQLQQARMDFQKIALQVQQSYPDLLKYVAIKPTNIRILQSKLPTDAIIIEPLILDDKIVLFLAPGGSKAPVYKDVIVSKGEIDLKIKEFRDNLQLPDQSAAQIQNLSFLYDVLIRPIESDLSGYKTLIISPYGNLRYIPFQALYDGKQYLVENYDIVNISSASALKFDIKSTSSYDKILAFANPTEDLPATEEEVISIQNSFPDTFAFFRKDALKSTFSDNIIKDFTIVHLATHGVLDANNPEKSRLLFAGGNENDLTVAEIAAYDFSNIDLIVLSACDSSIGRSMGAEVASLGAAFEMAAAPSVLATLWKVDDKATSLLISSFYKNLSTGTSKAESLRQAQIALLKDPKYSNPYYWAPFILWGNWN